MTSARELAEKIYIMVHKKKYSGFGWASIVPAIESLLSETMEEAKQQGISIGISRGNISNFQQSANPEQARKDFYNER